MPDYTFPCFAVEYRVKKLLYLGMSNLLFLRASIIKGSDGRSCLGASAYRRGEKMTELEDADPEHPNAVPATKKTWDFSAAEYIDRVRCSVLWNSNGRSAEEAWRAAGKCEKRKDAQQARELMVTLPRDVPVEIAEHLLLEFCENYVAPLGMLVDASMHVHGRRKDKDGKPVYQPHGHILMSTRAADATRESGFAATKNREWNKAGYLAMWREGWQRTLEKHNIQIVNPPMTAREMQDDERDADAGHDVGR